MHCFDDNIAVELFEGALSPEVERQVEEHAAACSDCRRLLAELARSPSLAGISPTIPVSAGDAHIDLHQGDKVGRFSVLSRIGHGGMGVVFSAYDPKLDRKVALKLIRSTENSTVSTEDAQARLLREAQAIAQQSHPNVISVYDVGTYKSEVYIAMELVEGHTLGTWLRLWKRPWRDILDKFIEAARALEAAHGTGLVHRDFKPDNVLVGDDERVRVMDFGLARSLFYDLPRAGDAGDLGDASDVALRLSIAGVSELNRTLTKTGALLGTPRYMAPEQFFGGAADARSDQFSFCVALYESLYGQHPFAAQTSRELAEDSTTAVLPVPPNSRAPGWLHSAILRGLEREPARRHASMRPLLQRLQPPQRGRPRQWLLAVAAMAVVVLALGAYAWRERSRSARARTAVVVATQRAERATEFAKRQGETLAQAIAEREQLRAERDAMRDTVRESVDAVAQLRQIEELLLEKDLTIAELEQDLQQQPRRRVARPKPPQIGLGLGAIRSRIAPRIAELKECFVEWRERQPSEEIRLLVRIEVDPDGQGTVADVLGAADRVLRLCISGALDDVTFPSSNGSTTVQYRFDAGPRRFTQSSRVVERSPAD